MNVPERALERVPPSSTTTTYGWSAEGKSSAQIAADIRQTRYRLDADLDALREKVARIKWPAVAGAALAAAVLLIRKIRR